MTPKMKQFLSELEQLLDRHNAEIYFDPRHGDTHGFGDAGIAVAVDKEEHLFRFDWNINAKDIQEDLE